VNFIKKENLMEATYSKRQPRGAEQQNEFKAQARLPGAETASHNMDLQSEPPPLKRVSIDLSGRNVVGQTIAHFKITAKIGEGAMGCILKAVDLNLQRTVALKILPLHLCKKAEEKQQFLQEARLLSSIDHPFICTVYEMFETEDGSLFMVMPCYDGSTLRARLEESRLTADQALTICKQIASGLSKAHEHGIVHQDVKPDNTILTRDNLIKIIDFGLARLIDHKSGDNGKMIMGTIAYMSPEQTFGNPVDARTDVWSLGVVLYEMLTGHLPFRGDYIQCIIHSILNEDPEPMEHLPERLQHIIAKCMAKEANDRYQNMRDLLVALEVYQTRERLLSEMHVKPRKNKHFWSGVALGI
jgi:serine/threonine-protein kinase